MPDLFVRRGASDRAAAHFFFFAQGIQLQDVQHAVGDLRSPITTVGAAIGDVGHFVVVVGAGDDLDVRPLGARRGDDPPAS